MRHQHRALTLLAGFLLAGIAAAQGSATLSWTPPTTNTDGTPLTNLAGYVVYRGPSPTTFPDSRTLQGGTAPPYTWDGLADGAHYFVVTAVNTANEEGAQSNVACAAIGLFSCSLPLQAPGPVRNLVVTVVETPPPAAVTVRVEQSGDTFNIIATGSGEVALRLVPSGAVLDWFKVSGQNSADISGVTPALGNNNDGRNANAIAFTAPVNGWADQDGSSVTGISVTVAGVTKQLARSGTTWSASF